MANCLEKASPEDTIAYAKKCGWLLLIHLEEESTRDDVTYLKTTLRFLNQRGDKISLEFNKRV